MGEVHVGSAAYMLKPIHGKSQASLAWIAKDGREEASQDPVEAVKPPCDLIIEGIPKEEVLLQLGLSQTS